MAGKYKNKLDAKENPPPLDPTHTMETWLGLHWSGNEADKAARIRHWNETFPGAARTLPTTNKKQYGGYISTPENSIKVTPGQRDYNINVTKLPKLNKGGWLDNL